MENFANRTFMIDPQTEVGAVSLAVKDLFGMRDFYRDVIGLNLLSQSSESVDLGADGRTLVRLFSKAGGISYPNATGLFHLALLLPNRAELGRWLNHLIRSGYPLDGVGDHLVSEALYLSDPEGNGIEMYRDRPRDSWEYANGQLRMDTLAVDLESLIAEANPEPFDRLPAGTKMGHIHLQVNNVAQTVAFYQDALGFDLVMQMPGAGFLSAGGYHHHIGMNTWRSYAGQIAPANALGLIDYQVLLPDDDAQISLLKRLTEKQVNFIQNDVAIRVQDPAGIMIEFLVGRS